MHTGHKVGSAGLQMGRRALPIRRSASTGRYRRGVQDKMVRQWQIFQLVRSRRQRHRLEVQSWCQALRAAIHKELTEKGVGVLHQPCPYVHHLQEQVKTLRIWHDVELSINNTVTYPVRLRFVVCNYPLSWFWWAYILVKIANYPLFILHKIYIYKDYNIKFWAKVSLCPLFKIKSILFAFCWKSPDHDRLD